MSLTLKAPVECSQNALEQGTRRALSSIDVGSGKRKVIDFSEYPEIKTVCFVQRRSDNLKDDMCNFNIIGE